MRIRCICPCGQVNYNRGDWVAHWKYGEVLTHPSRIEKYGAFLCRHPKLRAIYMFLLTRIEVIRA